MTSLREGVRTRRPSGLGPGEQGGGGIACMPKWVSVAPVTDGAEVSVSTLTTVPILLTPEDRKGGRVGGRTHSFRAGHSRAQGCSGRRVADWK